MQLEQHDRRPRGLSLACICMALCALAPAQDDPDRAAGSGYTFDQAYDTNGLLVQASSFGITSSKYTALSMLQVQTSVDQGQTWDLVYEGEVQGLTNITHLSLDVASGFSDPSADQRVYIGVIGINQEPQGTFYRAGLISGHYDTPWTAAECLPIEVRDYPEVPFDWAHLDHVHDGLRTSVAVLPHHQSMPYEVAFACSMPQYTLLGMDYDHYRNIQLNYSSALGLSFAGRSRLIAGDDPCAPSAGELTKFAPTPFNRGRECKGYRHPSLAWDLNNEVLVLAYDGDFGKKGRSVVVATVDPTRHLAKLSTFKGCYNGLESDTRSVRKEQHHPNVSSRNNLIAFTCLTGKPDPKFGSYRLTAFWGSAYGQPWQDAFTEVDDYLWQDRGFHDMAVTAADLSLRNDVLHFTARCIVDPAPGSPGTAIVQFRSEMLAPSESSRVIISDHPLSKVALAPSMAITLSPVPQRRETVLYDSFGDLWLDE